MTSNQSRITISHLFESPELVPMVASWIYNEFWSTREGYTPEYFVERLKSADSVTQIPLSLLGRVDGHPAGTINLIENDDDDRPQLSPWLAALVVQPEYRRLGLGSELVRSLLKSANELGFKTVYLGTDGPDFYIKLGAQVEERVRADFFILRFDFV